MIIKSLSRKSKSFGQLFDYMEKGREKDTPVISHNLPYLGNKNNVIIQAFQENAKLIKARKNGVMLYHEILSFHPDDKKQITVNGLKAIAEHYLQLRAPDGLGYGVFHLETKNPHVHLMISANTINSPQKIRLSKAKFQRVKHQIRKYIQRHYPDLENTLKRNKKKPSITISKKEEGMKKRNKKDKYLSIKDQVKQRVKQSLDQGASFLGFENHLQDQNIQLYTRGKQQGVIYQGKKYRLKTLGLADMLEERKKSWLRVKKRNKSVQAIFLEKVIREWKSEGFRERLLKTIETKKQNKRLLQLRKIADKKQRCRDLGRGEKFYF